MSSLPQEPALGAWDMLLSAESDVLIEVRAWIVCYYPDLNRDVCSESHWMVPGTRIEREWQD